MKAEEMFKAEGYKIVTNTPDLIEYYAKWLTIESYIIFYCDSLHYTMFRVLRGRRVPFELVNLKLHKAITKQTEELGWL